MLTLSQGSQVAGYTRTSYQSADRPVKVSTSLLVRATGARYLGRPTQTLIDVAGSAFIDSRWTRTHFGASEEHAEEHSTARRTVEHAT